jgi:flagellar biosynthesis/type III secretory pathway protein FliH
MRQMGLSDYNSSMNYARETGYAEGHADGHAEGRNEERQHFLEMLDQGLSVEEIKRRLKQ